MVADAHPGPRIALITGATSGIGAEFAHQLAARHYNLVLVARDSARLESVASTLLASYGVVVEILPADLATVKGRSAVEKRLKATSSPVDVLVNNAGYGLKDSFEANSVADEQRLMDVLVTAPMRFAHAALTQMLPRRNGTIINIASLAGYTPRGTYGANKAWVLSFSRWANYHYKRQGIFVTGVAPGFVRTEMHQRMGVRTDNFPDFLWISTERIVAGALRDAARGRAISVPTLRYKLIVLLIRLLPARLVALGSLRSR